MFLTNLVRLVGRDQAAHLQFRFLQADQGVKFREHVLKGLALPGVHARGNVLKGFRMLLRLLIHLRNGAADPAVVRARSDLGFHDQCLAER